MDGNGHTIQSSGTGIYDCDTAYPDSNAGIYLIVKTGVTIKNFTIKNFCTGIEARESVSNSILNNVFSNNFGSSITVISNTSGSSHDNTVSGNTITGNFALGCTVSCPQGMGIFASSTGLIENNNISNVGEGIASSGSGTTPTIKNNIIDSTKTGISVNTYEGHIVGNTITNSEDVGIKVTKSNNKVYENLVSNSGTGLVNANYGWVEVYKNTFSNNQKGLSGTHSASIYHNNFLNNVVNADHGSAAFSSSNSGNYWSDYSPYCDDTNIDNICDSPYPFSSSADDGYPWVIQDGWLTQITNPGGLTLEAPTTSGLARTFSVVATHDGSSMSVTCDNVSGTIYQIGNTTTTCTAQNGIKTSFDTSVYLDPTAPTISIPSNITVISPDNSGLAVTFDVTASDNFAVTSGPTCSTNSGSTFPIGTTTITCTASDAAGNVGTETFTVAINLEDVSPVVTVPADITFNLLETETDTIAEFSVNATDNFAVTVGPTCTPASGSTFSIGNSTVTCTAADAAGNVGTDSFSIIVVEYDSTAPTVTVPSDITVYEIASNVGAVSTFSVSAEDNVAVTTGPTCTPISGTTFSVGDNTVTCTAEDANGNVGTSTFVVTVVEYTTPTIATANARLTNSQSIPVSSTLGVSQQVFIAVDMNSDATTDLDFAYLVEVTGAATDEISLVGSLPAGQALSPSIGWAPPLHGDYTLTIKVVDNMTNKNLLSTPITLQVNVPEPVSPITVGLNKSNYVSGDVITVSGTIQDGGTSDVTVQIKSGSSVVSLSQVSVDSSGSFSTTLNTNNLSTGTYTVVANRGSDTAEMYFSFEMTNDLPTSVTVTNAAGSSTPGCEVNNACFIPYSVTIATGGTVTWENTDTAAHTATSGTASDGPSGIFDSSLIMAGSSFSTTINSPGTYQYFCMVHPWMYGIVLVGGSAEAPVEQEPPVNISMSLGNTEYNLNEIITVSISLSNISDDQQVIIDVLDPEGTPMVTRAMTVSPNSGSSMNFKVSENSLTGNYKIVASVTTGGTTVTESIYFKIKSQYNQFQIASVEVTDQQGNSSILNRGDMAYIKVTLTSDISIEPLVTVNFFDAELTTLGVGSVKSPLNQGESEIILSFLIPDDAALGDADIFVNAFTNWVSSGGIPLTPEFSITAEISP